MVKEVETMNLIPSNNNILITAPSGYETVIQIDNLQGDYVLANEVYYQGGGHGGNLAFYLSKLGVKCALYTHWGDDIAGFKAKQNMLEAGVDISLCQVFEGESSQSNYLINIGKNKKTIMNFGTALAKRGNIMDDLPTPNILYTSLLPTEPALNLINKVNKSGGEVILGFQIPTSVTKNLNLTHEIIEMALPHVGHVIGSYKVVADEFKSTLKPRELIIELYYRFPQLKTIILTDGKNGAFAYQKGTNKSVIHQPAFPITEIDATGAGDQFIAVFIQDYLLNGHSLAASLRRAAIYSAVVCLNYGSRILVTNNEVKKLINDERVSEWLR